MSRFIAPVLCGMMLMVACSSGGGGSLGTGDGGATSSGGALSPCEEAGRRICERACECGSAAGTEKCATTHRRADAGATATLIWKSPSDCEAAYMNAACKSPGASKVDFAACKTAVDSSTCADSAIIVPSDACDAPKGGG